MSRRATVLSGLEIDEVSTVRRDANGHAKIAFAKSADEETAVGYTDENGQEIDVDDLQIGDVFYDAEGAEYVVEEDDGDAEGEVGKGVSQFGAKAFAPGTTVGGLGRKAKMPFKPGTSLDKKKMALGAAGAGAVGAGAYGASKVGKSFAETVLEDISKAASERDRNIILSKALGRIEEVEARNEEIAKAYEAERDARLTDAWIAKSAEYNLPISPEVLGPIMKSLEVGEALSEEEFVALEGVLKSVGEMLFSEIGAVGESADASVMRQVDALVDGLVEKSGEFSREEATVAFFEANPDAYDAYIQSGR